MPDLSAQTWERCPPNLGDNRKQERPFYFLVRANLTIAERDSYVDRLSSLIGSKDTTPEKLAELLGEFIRMGDEPLTVDGKPIASLLDYLHLLNTLAGTPLVNELFGWVPYVNSMEGARDRFFEQRSGASAFMTLATEAKVEPSRLRR